MFPKWCSEAWYSLLHFHFQDFAQCSFCSSSLQVSSSRSKMLTVFGLVPSVTLTVSITVQLNIGTKIIIILHKITSRLTKDVHNEWTQWQDFDMVASSHTITTNYAVADFQMASFLGEHCANSTGLRWLASEFFIFHTDMFHHSFRQNIIFIGRSKYLKCLLWVRGDV